MEQSKGEVRDRPSLQGRGELCTQRGTFQTVFGKTSKGRSCSLNERMLSQFKIVSVYIILFLSSWWVLDLGISVIGGVKIHNIFWMG